MPRIITTFGDIPVIYEIHEGGTLQKFMLEKYPEQGNFPLPVVAWKDGDPLMRKDWPLVELHGEEAISITVLPLGGGNGGSNPLQIIFQVVLIIIAIVMCWNPMGWTAFGLTVAQTGALMASAVMVAGSLLMGALFKPKPLSPGHSNALDTASPTYSIGVSGNQARLLQPEPEGFGRLSVIPDFVAIPYSIFEGNEMYLYQVFGLGRGLYEQHSMAFGDVVFWRDGELLTDSAYVSVDENGKQSERRNRKKKWQELRNFSQEGKFF